MTHDHVTVAVFATHESAEAAVRRLSEADFPIERLSIIGRGYEPEEQVVGGLGALGGALARIGVPNDRVLRYEQDLRAENFLVVVHGSEAEAQRAKGLLTAGNASRVEVHTPKAAAVPTASHGGEASPVVDPITSHGVL